MRTCRRFPFGWKWRQVQCIYILFLDGSRSLPQNELVIFQTLLQGADKCSVLFIVNSFRFILSRLPIWSCRLDSDLPSFCVYDRGCPQASIFRFSKGLRYFLKSFASLSFSAKYPWSGYRAIAGWKMAVIHPGKRLAWRLHNILCRKLIYL